MHLSTSFELSSNLHYKYLLITYLVCTTVYISSFWNILYLQLKYLFIITYLVCTTACIYSFWVILYIPLQICIHYLSCTYLYKHLLITYPVHTTAYIYSFFIILYPPLQIFTLITFPECTYLLLFTCPIHTNHE